MPIGILSAPIPQAIIDASTAALRAKIAELDADRIAAFYVEPIQGSGGVLVPPPSWLKAMHAVCKENDILFVADEVITGFGRVGPLFACEEDDVVPDFMTTAKGLTSGYVPMGAVFMSDRVYNTIADGAGKTAVGHGYTYSGHPVSAAVGLACLDLYQNGLLENGRKAGHRLMEGLRSLADHPLVGDVRGRGMLAQLSLSRTRSARRPYHRKPTRRAASSTAHGITASSSAPLPRAYWAMRRRFAARTRRLMASSNELG